MRYLILADIHGNLPALNAVLATGEAASCDRIISLGDQVNYGPQSPQVLARLRELDAIMLLGNHEERLMHLHSPDLQGYNWTLLHWTASQLNGWIPDLPVDLRIGSALFTHGTPGDPYQHLDKLLPGYLDTLPDDVTHLFCGHSHRTLIVEHGGHMAINPGSVGAGKTLRGCTATFAVYDSDDGSVTLHAAPYSAEDVARAFIRSGATQAAPMMCRVVQQTIETGTEESVSALMRHIIAVGAPHGLGIGDQAAWEMADATFTWTVPLATADYWKMMEDTLL